MTAVEVVEVGGVSIAKVSKVKYEAKMKLVCVGELSQPL